MGLTGKDGHFIHARKMTIPSKEDKRKKIDIGLVGEVVKIDPDIIDLLDTARLYSRHRAHGRG